MSDSADIVAQMRRAVELLATIGDQAATSAAAAIAGWLAGEDFDTAAGLVPGWRRHQQLRSRDHALEALVKLNPTLDASALADRIIAGIARATRSSWIRPDGEAGYFRDLFAADTALSSRRLRGLIQEIRGRCKLEMAKASDNPRGPGGK